VTKDLLDLASRMRENLAELDQVVERVEEGWRRAQQSSDDFYLDSVALNLHGFYAGLERVFELVAAVIDGTKPEGANWHRELLRQMATEISRVRPAVISETTCDRLDEYRGFRHVVRNVYTFKLDPAKVQKLVEALPSVFRRLQEEFLAFAHFLEIQAP
jgi:uncharacterized protein YutE (UPF0331/DUF86 family)